MKRLLTKNIKMVTLSLGMSIFTTSAFAYSGEDFVVCRLNPAGDNYLSLRTCGSARCQEIRRLGPGTFLISLEPYAVKRWREVIVKRHAQDESYTGPSGWVYSKYICKIQY